jgi:protein-S-isoprenylcysteine O-methyltransferase Ste14
VHLGAAAYASLVTVSQFLITGEAAMSAVGMLPSLVLGIAMLAGQLDFRVARPSSRGWNLVKTLTQTVILWTTALLLVPQFLVLLERRLGIPGFQPMTTAGWAVFGTASSLGLWSGWTMAWQGRGTPLPLDTARLLVIAGPYAWIRNPMAMSGISQGIGVALVLGSVSVIAYSLAGGFLWQWIARPREEADLLARFGEPYASYREAVPCWIPRKSRYVIQL